MKTDSEDSRRDPRKKAMNLLLYRDRTEKELLEKLRDAGFSEQEAEEGVRYTASFGYLNDRRYAENYVWFAKEKKSRGRIRRELEEKGIPEEIAEEALSVLPEDETGQVYELLRRKAGQPHCLEQKELRRVYGFLARKGFRQSDIWTGLRMFQAGETPGDRD